MIVLTSPSGTKSNLLFPRERDTLVTIFMSSRFFIFWTGLVFPRNKPPDINNMGIQIPDTQNPESSENWTFKSMINDYLLRDLLDRPNFFVRISKRFLTEWLPLFHISNGWGIGVHIPFKLWNICKLTSFLPFEIWTSPDFKSPPYPVHSNKLVN